MAEISFIDEVNIKLKSGDGGNGISSFHREKYIDKGGPDGGNGGNGGSIYFKANSNLNTLLSFKRKRIFKAVNGGNGGTNNRTGRSGEDLIIDVPLGTEVIINDKREADLFFNSQIYLLTGGGKGGRGNSTFKSSRNISPTLHENGEKTPWIDVKLNLKVLADIGLLGYPNVGKSTFLSVVSNAKPKIADYSFTTLTPNLGVIKHQEYSFVITDLPGLIEGASENKGMGKEFLKHLSRTKIIAHLIDGTFVDIKEKYDSLRKELKIYSTELFSKDEIIVITKNDLIDEDKRGEILKIFKDTNVFFISSVQRKGLSEILIFLGQKLEKMRAKENIELQKKIEDSDYALIKLEKKDIHNEDDFLIIYENNSWIISGEFPEYWAKRIPVDTHENFLRIWMKFKTKGIIKKLRELGIKENDIVIVKNTNLIFEYRENII